MGQGQRCGDGVAAAIHVVVNIAARDVGQLAAHHNGFVATAINGVPHAAAQDVDLRVAFHTTCRRAGVALMVFVDAATAAIHVALQLIRRRFRADVASGSDFASGRSNGDVGVGEHDGICVVRPWVQGKDLHMAVLAAAKH